MDISPKNVLQEGLIHPDRDDRAARITDERLEDFEPWAAGRPDGAALNASRDRDVLAGLERRDCLQVPAIFVTERKSVDEIFDGDEADAM
jgi:hypothetical protein